MADVPAANPSNPSVRLAAFETAVIISMIAMAYTIHLKMSLYLPVNETNQA